VSELELDLDAISQRNEERKRIKAAASPGPWRWVEETYGSGPWSYTSHLEDGNGSALAFPSDDSCFSIEIVIGDEDKTFIAHARNDDVEDDIDTLLAEVESLRVSLDEWRNLAWERRLRD